MSTELEEFARLLIVWVRDAAIRSSDRMFQSQGPTGKRWKEAAASSSSPEAFAAVIIPDVVDTTIAHLLGAINQEVLRLSFTASNGKSVDLTTSSGELSGWYGGGGGWCDRYSRERFVDDFADLKDFFNKQADGDRG